MDELAQLILQGKATTAQRLMYADYLEENGAIVRPRLIRLMAPAEEAHARFNRAPERRTVTERWVWWNRAKLRSDGASHLPPSLFYSLTGGEFREIGCNFATENLARSSLKRAFLRSWLHGWRPAEADIAYNARQHSQHQ